MPKEVVATRVEPEFKAQIEREAANKDRDSAWLVRRLLELGWDAYKAPKARKSAA